MREGRSEAPNNVYGEEQQRRCPDGKRGCQKHGGGIWEKLQRLHWYAVEVEVEMGS